MTAFKHWPKPVAENKREADCTYCKKRISVASMGINAVRPHMHGAIATRLPLAAESSFSAPPAELADVTATTASSASSSDVIRVAIGGTATLYAEGICCLNTAVKNHSLNSNEGISDIFKSVFPDLVIAKTFRCGKDKSGYILRFGLAPYFKQQLADSINKADLESYVQGHKKKHGTKSPCQSLSNAKGSQGDGRRWGHSAELNGPAERRKNCTLRNSQEVEQHPESERRSHPESERRSHPVTKTKSRGLPTERSKGKGKGGGFLTNGGLVPALSSHRKDGGPCPDTFGETSSESYSSPSSPQHRPESMDSEEERNKDCTSLLDTDSHSEDSSKGPGHDVFFTQRTDPAVAGDAPPSHTMCSKNRRPQMQPLCPETSTDPPPLSLASLAHSLPHVLPSGAADPPLPLVPPSSQSLVPDGKPSSGNLMMQMPLSPSAVAGSGILAEPEKRDMLPTFGLLPIGRPPSGNPAAQPLVQRFKTASCHGQGGSDGAPGSASSYGSAPAAPPASHQVPVRAISVMSHGPPPYSSHQPQDPAGVGSGPAPSLPHVEPPQAKRPGLTLPSGLPSPYTLPPAPASAAPAGGAAAGVPPSPGHAPAAAAPAVPTHTPGAAPSPSPAPTHSTAHSDCTSYSKSSASCGSASITPGNPITVQQAQQQQLPPQQQQQQQPMGCGTCGCHNNCGGQVSVSSSVSAASGCQAPLFFPAHQMAAARQVFSVPPPLFQLTGLCSSSYLSQAQPHHQSNGAATLSPFFPAAPPPAHPPPYGPLHTHSHGHADVPSHILGTQAAAAATAAGYSFQQQMVPAASFCQRVYQQHIYPNPLGMLPTAALGGGGVNKKNGNVSCYNCGVSGHYAQECSQPSVDSTQQGGFRLKYVASHISEALDNAE